MKGINRTSPGFTGSLSSRDGGGRQPRIPHVGELNKWFTSLASLRINYGVLFVFFLNAVLWILKSEPPGTDP